MRNVDGKCAATTQFDGHAFRVECLSPSGALRLLTVVLSRAINKLQSAILKDYLMKGKGNRHAAAG